MWPGVTVSPDRSRGEPLVMAAGSVVRAARWKATLYPTVDWAAGETDQDTGRIVTSRRGDDGSLDNIVSLYNS